MTLGFLTAALPGLTLGPFIGGLAMPAASRASEWGARLGRTGPPAQALSA